HQGCRRPEGTALRLVHLTTVPGSLFFLRGQPAFFRRLGLEELVISSPGEELSRFAREEGVDAAAVVMPRAITPLRDLATIVRLYRKLRACKPTIVHAHTPKGGLLG